MDTPRSKEEDLQREYEEYLLEESLKNDSFSTMKPDVNGPEKQNLDKEYEEYIKKELVESFPTNKKTSPSNFPKKRFLKYSLAIMAAFLLTVISYTAFVFVRIHLASNKISGGSSSLAENIRSTALSIMPSQRKELSGEKNGRINILLLGAAGEKKPGANLTDTIMIASIDTQSKKIALLSLPRDTYVKIPESDSYTKLNGLYQYGLKNGIGIDAVRKSVEEIAGLPIQYYLVVDFDGFVKFIDALGGINVNVERDIYDTRYPGPNYSYQTFELKKGFHELDGETALKYVRERHTDPEGDFGRAKRQQQVMQSVKNKVFSIKTFLNPLKLNELLAELEKNIKTNLALDDIESFLILSKELDTQNISTKVVDAWKKDSLLKVSHVFYGETRAFVLVPRAGNYSQIQDLAENIFDIGKIEKRKSEIAKENAKILIINASSDKEIPQKIKSLLSGNMGMRDISISSQVPLQKNIATEVFDLTNKTKLFTLDEIITSVPAKLSEKSPPDNFKKYDFVLVLGKDLVETYRFEEGDIEQFKNAQDNQEYFEISNQQPAIGN